jgi:hypothetical protein
MDDYYDEDDEIYEDEDDAYVDDEGDSYTDRLTAIEEYLAAGQGVPGGVPVSPEDAEMLAEAYEAEQEDAELEEALRESIQTIENELDRDLTSIEIEALVDEAMDTGRDPAQFYRDIVPTNLADEEDRTFTMASCIEDAEDEQEAAEAEGIASSAEAAGE